MTLPEVPALKKAVRYGYGEAGHDFTPMATNRNRCQYAGAGYCGGKRSDEQHQRREVWVPA